MAAAGMSFDHFLNNFAKRIEGSKINFEVLKANEFVKIFMHSFQIWCIYLVDDC